MCGDKRIIHMSIIQQLTQTDLFKRNKCTDDSETSILVGPRFRLSYTKAGILVADASKQKAKAIPQGCFLLAFYENKLDK